MRPTTKKSCGRRVRAEELDHAAGERIGELRTIREDVCRIAASHGASNVRVFGSIGRGEQALSSDLDLLVDMAEGRSLFDLIALSNDLEESLGLEMDVLTEASLSPYIRDRVLQEAVAL